MRKIIWYKRGANVETNRRSPKYTTWVQTEVRDVADGDGGKQLILLIRRLLLSGCNTSHQRNSEVFLLWCCPGTWFSVSACRRPAVALLKQADLSCCIITNLLVGVARCFDISTLLSKRTEGRGAHYEEINVNCYYKLLPLVFPAYPTRLALEVVKLILSKSTLQEKFRAFTWACPSLNAGRRHL